MDFAKVHSIYLIGIGGIGMSALARYFNAEKKFVSGYDKSETKLTQSLIAEGIKIQYSDDTRLFPENIDLVIYTPAVPNDLNILQALRKRNIPMFKRAEILGMLVNNNRAIAVAGTHGKTTVSTMIAWLFHQSSQRCNAFLGGLSKNFNSNLIQNDVSEFYITEADEFDKSFLQLHPEIAIITSVDPDHLDIYGSEKSMQETFEKFTENITDYGTLIMKEGLPINARNNHTFSYSLKKESDFYAENIQLENGYYHFDFVHPTGKIQNIQLGVQGWINVENAVAALAAGYIAGLNIQELQDGLKSFKGIKRRFETQLSTSKVVYIDDYAHHPTEIFHTIEAIRKIYPDKTILGIFQPHLYSRTKDFAQEFATSLDLLDKCILLDIYPAREKPVEGVTSKLISDLMLLKNKELIKQDELLKVIEKKDFDILLTMGAGNIDQYVESIRKLLTKKYNVND